MINSTFAKTPDDNLGFGPFVAFVVNKDDAVNAQIISLINTDFNKIIAATHCTGQAGIECINEIPIANTWFSSLSCSAAGTNFFVPTPGNYKVEITYADGTQRSSVVVFQDPCASLSVVKNSSATRTIASLENDGPKGEMKLYLPIVLLFAFAGVLVGLYRKSTRK